jgi:DNA-binding transcriptional regulator of glucitol operon
MDRLLPFFLIFAVLWVLQLYGTAKQGQHFMRQVSRLRPLGETAIGASSMDRLKRRVYVCLAADATDRVTGAIELSGVTIFARAQDIDELIGRPLIELARDGSQERRALAARMAAKTLLGEELDVPIKERRKWTIGGPGRAAQPDGTAQPGGARSDGEDAPEVRG